MRLRLIALVLLVIAAIAAGFVLTRVDSSRDVWLVFGTGLALAAVTGVLALARDRQRQAMPEVERYFTLAPELVVLAGLDGYWKRVNPTVEAVLGYIERDWRARPFMELELRLGPLDKTNLRLARDRLSPENPQVASRIWA